MTDLEQIAQSWQPASIEERGDIGERTAVGVAAFFGTSAPAFGEPLPVMWHEAFLREHLRLADLGDDGHPARSGLLPPIPRRKRLFGGGSLTVLRPLAVGETAVRTAAVVQHKVRQGSAGKLLIVTESHTWTVAGEPRLSEQRDLVYLKNSGAAAPAAERVSGEPEGEVVRRVAPDEKMLFTYSALTGNAHRIHYDATYAREVEHHAGLLVHGPLVVTFGTEILRARMGALAGLDYRLLAPTFVGDEITYTVSELADGELTIRAWSGGRQCLTVTGRSAAK
ncbi:MaoC family dehydratase N-terminal domain-containing protein [soil metagenome]